MPAPVDRVIFHHEGAGVPTDKTARPLHQKYSIAIGVTLYTMARPPWQSFITDGTKGFSLQIVFTGNRNLFTVTDNDIRLVERAMRDAKTMHWVTTTPRVQHHGDSDPGTECPGNSVELRRADLERACGLLPVTTPPTPSWPYGGDYMPKPTDIMDVLHNAEGCWELTADGGVRTVSGPFHNAYPAIPGQPPRLFYAITANIGRPGYTEWATDGFFCSWPDGRWPV